MDSKESAKLRTTGGHGERQENLGVEPASQESQRTVFGEVTGQRVKEGEGLMPFPHPFFMWWVHLPAAQLTRHICRLPSCRHPLRRMAHSTAGLSHLRVKHLWTMIKTVCKWLYIEQPQTFWSLFPKKITNNNQTGNEEMTPRLRVSTALSEEFPASPGGGSQLPVITAPGDPMPLTSTCMYPPTQKDRQTHLTYTHN